MSIYLLDSLWDAAIRWLGILLSRAQEALGMMEWISSIYESGARTSESEERDRVVREDDGGQR